MQRIKTQERPEWKRKAAEYGFKFHTMWGESYWDERAYYAFTIEQIEKDLEEPTAEIHQMCLQVVDRVVHDGRLLKKFSIPEPFWDLVRTSWMNRDPSLYSRIDFAYDGKSPAKLYENNADTPTSLYETGFWQWVWLDDMIKAGELPEQTDQFNSLQEKLVARFSTIEANSLGGPLHFSCCEGSEEDRGTVQYLEDCARESGIDTKFVYVDDIGYGEGDVLTDLDDQIIERIFKLYPLEFMFEESFGRLLLTSNTQFIEPFWKAVLSNKALLPLLWEMFPRHPNLLPAYFEGDSKASELTRYVRKPLFSREGSNISIVENGNTLQAVTGPYGAEGYILQAYHPLPRFDENHTLVGSWLVDGEPAGISIREDTNQITQDLSRFLPHIIS